MNLLLFYLLTSVILATKEVSTSMLLNHFKNLLGQNYSVVKITEDNLNDVLKLMQANTYYYSQIPFPTPSLDTCRKDLTALPPNTDMKQKNYIALYTGHDCMAIMDYIESYPSKDIVYLGLFMLHPDYHHQGLGKKLIHIFIESAKVSHFSGIKLACYEVNAIGYSFWKKIGFVTERTCMRELNGVSYTLLEMYKPCL